MSKYTKLTVAIPTSDMDGKDVFLRRVFESLWNQSFQDFDIVVSDNSDDDVIKDICEYYKQGITYYRNPIKGMPQNTNEAIRQSKGELIKILYMDDYLAHDEALREIVDKFDGRWLITAADNNLNPYFTEDIHTGNNKLGSPSALTILNNDPMMFDENLTWLLDCDYYRRMYEKWGEPTIIETIGVKIGVGPHQATNTMGDERKAQEHEYLMKKYG